MGSATLPDLKIYPNPSGSAAEVKLEEGLNLSDNLLEMSRENAAILKNLVWVRNTLQRRRGFQRYSTEDLSAMTKWRGGIEFIDRWGNRRLILGTHTGRIIEWQSAVAHADVKTGLSTQQDIYFAQAFNALFAVNSQDAAQRIEGNSVAATPCTARDMGPPAVIAGVGMAAGTAGNPNGSYVGIVTAVREESGLKVLESDWSNLATVTVANQKITFTWSATADSRVTHYYIYRSAAGGSILYYEGKVAVGTLTYSADTTEATLAGSRPAALQYRNGAPPVGKYIVSCGGRLVILNLTNGENAFHCSIAGIDSYVVENFPIYDAVNLKFFQGGNHKITCPGNGPITAARAIGESGERSARANNLFVAQETSCYILPDANPNNPLQEISGQIGCVAPRAHAQYGQGIFFQSRRGVEFWPGTGKTVYLVSDQITPAFTGGGNQNLTANQSVGDITYTVDGDTLLITVRDVSTSTIPNKVYALDLIHFMSSFNQGKMVSRYAGPWQNNGYGLFVPLADRGLILLDNTDVTILKRSATSYQDWVGGANVTADIRILTGPAMKEFKMARNKLHFFDLFAFSNTDSRLRLLGENGAYDVSDIVLAAVTYPFPWDDLVWSDLTWQYDTWHAEAALPWSAVAHFWQFDITNRDSSGDFVFYGYALRYSSALRTRTFR